MELIFEDLYHKMQCRIYLKEQQGSWTVLIGYNGEYLVRQDISESELPDEEYFPLLIIPIQMKTMLISAFISEGSKLQLRTENENLLKGKLAATETHLNDMREMSKKLLDSLLDRV